MSEDTKRKAFENTIKRVVDHERMKGKDVTETFAREKAVKIMERLEKENKK